MRKTKMKLAVWLSLVVFSSWSLFAQNRFEAIVSAADTVRMEQFILEWEQQSLSAAKEPEPYRRMIYEVCRFVFELESQNDGEETPVVYPGYTVYQEKIEGAIYQQISFDTLPRFSGSDEILVIGSTGAKSTDFSIDFLPEVAAADHTLFLATPNGRLFKAFLIREKVPELGVEMTSIPDHPAYARKKRIENFIEEFIPIDNHDGNLLEFDWAINTFPRIERIALEETGTKAIVEMEIQLEGYQLLLQKDQDGVWQVIQRRMIWIR